MKAALIGSNGVIGSRLVESFQLGDGPTIVAIEARPADLTLASRFSIDVRLAELRETDSLTRAFAGCGLAIYARAEPASEAKRVASTLCVAAARANVRRVVYLSTPELGNCPAESSDAPEGLATEAEQAAERTFLIDCKKLGIVGHVLRPGVVYGPRSPLVATVAAELRENRAWLIARGEAGIPAVYVDNVIDAIRACLRSKTAPAEVVEVIDPDTGTWREFYLHLARELEFSGSRIRDIAPQDIASVASDALGRARLQQLSSTPLGNASSRLAGYTPAVSLLDGIRRSCAWWRFTQGQWSAAA